MKSALLTGIGATPFHAPRTGFSTASLKHRRQVLQVDPRHPLPPVAQPAAHPHAERRQHLLQRAALRVQHDPDANPSPPEFRSASAASASRLPSLADFRQYQLPAAVDSRSTSSPRDP